MKIIWKPILGYEDYYEASSCGKIRTVKRVVKNRYSKRVVKRKIISQREKNNGYLIVTLSKNNKVTTEYVHRLVALAFVKNPKNKPEVNHLDGNKKNNIAKNLSWCTHKENHKHASLIGLIASGEKQGNSKLKKEDVLKIRKLFGVLGSNKLAEMFNINPRTVRYIVTRDRWKHI